VSLVEQELLTLPEHLRSPPVFSVVHVARFSVFCVMFCRSLFVLFLLVIEVSVLLQLMNSDYHLVFSNYYYLFIVVFISVRYNVIFHIIMF